MLQEFVQQVKDTVREELSDVHTAFPAKIVSVDTGTGLATVQPLVKKVCGNGSTMDYPQISGVPIVLTQGNNQVASISIPVKPGDGCLLVISEQSLEYWLYGRETDTTLLFDITNAICIPGLCPKPPDSFADACNKNAIIIDVGETRITVKEDKTEFLGEVKVEAGATQFNIKKSGVDIVGEVSIKGDVNIDGNLTVPDVIKYGTLVPL